jgi:hypothetical protein
MRPDQLAAELQEAAKRLQVRLDWLEAKRLHEITMIASAYAEMQLLDREYAKDRADERNGDWTR